RNLRLEANERMDSDGEIVTKLDDQSVRDAVQQLIEAGVESLVIHFLHSYINDAHEVRAEEIAREMWPNDYVTRGSAIMAEYREYERGTTAMINASVQPVLDRYIQRLRDELQGRGYAHDLLVMQGNGGTVSSKIIADAAVNTVMSGPASGVIAAAYTAMRAGQPNVIACDMGGTSCDVALIKDGIPEVSSELEIEYAMPIHVPMVDVRTIGAGGGSIAHISAAGILEVGPESAGSVPGPICYGRGGTQPTITDANLVLGRLNPDAILAADAKVSLQDVRDALIEQIAQPLGLASAEDAAAAIIQIANTKMAGALRMVSLARGHDPRDFALFPFGGAGPLHAAALARELGVPKVLVPARPGITNAVGCIVADVRHDYVNTINTPLPAADMDSIAAIFRDQERRGRETIESEGIEIEEIVVLHDVDMQFQGQTHILTVPIASPDVSREALHDIFAKAYWNRFEVELDEIRPVVVNLHTAVIGRRKGIDLSSLMNPGDRTETLEGARIGTRDIWFGGKVYETPIYRREKLPLGASFDGPAILEQLDTTIVVGPPDSVVVDDFANVILSVGSL
ncbi:MAG: N-methylhydantoinase A, partial [Alphaproteobacteria bacterium]